MTVQFGKKVNLPTLFLNTHTPTFILTNHIQLTLLTPDPQYPLHINNKCPIPHLAPQPQAFQPTLRNLISLLDLSIIITSNTVAWYCLVVEIYFTIPHVGSFDCQSCPETCRIAIPRLMVRQDQHHHDWGLGANCSPTSNSTNSSQLWVHIPRHLSKKTVCFRSLCQCILSHLLM